MASLVPAPARPREVFPESRCWALDGRRAKRRLELVLRSDALFEPGSNVDFSRKRSSIFLISNRRASSLVRTKATPSSSGALARPSTLTSGTCGHTSTNAAPTAATLGQMPGVTGRLDGQQGQDSEEQSLR
jgi:hypothetical protein